MSKYIEEGRRSYHVNKGRYINPYKSDTREHDDFERGWSQELKRSLVSYD